MDALTGSDPTRSTIVLSVVRALLGEVTPEIRRVGFILDGRKIQVLCIHDGTPSEGLSGGMSDVETEILADFAADVSVEVQLVRVDAPANIDRNAEWVYARKEVEAY